MPVYAMRCGDYVKVGTTSAATARRRLRQIQAMCPYAVTLVGEARELGPEVRGPLSLEAWHHARLLPWHHWNEWYHWRKEVEAHLAQYFSPLNEVAPRGGPPPRRLGENKTRLAEAFRRRCL